MKKVIFTFMCVSALALNSSFGQGFYIKGGASYAFPAGRQPFITNDVRIGATGFSEILVATSYGKGVIPTVGIGFMFTENIGIEIAGSYLFGGKTESNISQLIGPDQTETISISSSATGINILPALVLRAPINGQIGIYSRTGLIMPVGGKIVTDITDVYAGTDMNTSIAYTREVKGKMTLGFAGAIGLNVRLSDRISFWAEANGQLLNVWAKSAELTAFTQDGDDILATLPVVDKQTTYVKEIYQNSNNDVNPGGLNKGLPYQELTEQVSFHNVGVGLGVAIHF